MNLRNLTVDALKEIKEVCESRERFMNDAVMQLKIIGACTLGIANALIDEEAEIEEFKSNGRREGLRLLMRYNHAKTVIEDHLNFSKGKVDELRDLIAEMEGESDK